jgi:hypothetical protein
VNLPLVVDENDCIWDGLKNGFKLSRLVAKGCLGLLAAMKFC